jgi:hypothetical protein
LLNHHRLNWNQTSTLDLSKRLLKPQRPATRHLRPEVVKRIRVVVNRFGALRGRRSRISQIRKTNVPVRFG